MVYMVGGIAAALAFPLVALILNEAWHRRRNRRLGRRRTEKIRL
jgi:hypothetical protein